MHTADCDAFVSLLVLFVLWQIIGCFGWLYLVVPFCARFDPQFDWQQRKLTQLFSLLPATRQFLHKEVMPLITPANGKWTVESLKERIEAMKDESGARHEFVEKVKAMIELNKRGALKSLAEVEEFQNKFERRWEDRRVVIESSQLTIEAAASLTEDNDIVMHNDTEENEEMAEEGSDDTGTEPPLKRRKLTHNREVITS